ncbi:hypothetical protein F4803DRAFT_522249 [Xylaria telfairii]|nr:hypothetical protein F4803DRAFT_522249 [Xylaria telfairii]
MAAETQIPTLPKEKRALAPTNETMKLLPPTPLDEGDKRRSTDSDIEVDVDTTNTNWNDLDTEQNKSQIPSKKAEGKGKSVAWDSTVARGETESDPDPDPQSESSHESYEREPADYYTTQRDPALGGGGDPRKRRTPTSPIRNETPAQSKEFINLLYPPDEPDKREESRLASLAMPGRRRGRYVGRGRGRGLACSQCGHRE